MKYKVCIGEVEEASDNAPLCLWMVLHYYRPWLYLNLLERTHKNDGVDGGLDGDDVYKQDRDQDFWMKTKLEVFSF